MDLLETALRAAHAGGAKLLEGLTRPKEVSMKSSRANIVTWADEAAQAAIIEVILNTYPDHGVLGEEGDGGDPNGPYIWIVDPLDGTSNYARGLSPWGSSIAVRKTGGPLVAGVIFDPFRNELFSGVKGAGTELSVSDTTDIRKAIICTGLQNDDADIIHEYVLRVAQYRVACLRYGVPGCRQGRRFRREERDVRLGYRRGSHLGGGSGRHRHQLRRRPYQSRRWSL
jgi:myo-inositol-1(or 4)-monophosphatase